MRKVISLIASIAILFGAVAGSGAFAAPAAYPGGVHWVNIPVRSAAQKSNGQNGGEGGQCIMGMVRCASDDNRIYMCGDMHGVWRSDNGGAFWHPCRSAGLSNNSNTAIAVNPNNHDVVLDYTGADYQTSRNGLAGIYRSTNGGDTWTRTLTVANYTNGGIERPSLAFASDGTHVYLGSYANGFYRSTDGGVTWSGSLSLNGATFNKISVDPTNVTRVWAATGTGVQLSTDGGSTWTVKAASGTNVNDVSADPQTANRVYYVLPGTGLERSNDGGSTWSLVSSSLNSSADRLFQSPINSNYMILSSGSSSIVTSNAGSSWTNFSVDTSKTYNSPNGWNMDGGTVWSYTNVNNVVGGNACLVYASTNAGVNWSDSSTGFTGFYHQWSNTTMAFANSDSTRYAMFCDDMNSSLTFDSGSTWITKGLPAQVEGWWGAYAGDMSPNWNSTPIIVNASGNYFLDDIMRTTTGTNTNKDWVDEDATNANNLFIRFSLQNSSLVYCDNHRSTDAGVTWTTLSQTVRGIAPSNGNIVYAYSGGNVMKSTDTGNNWTTLPAPPASAGGNIIGVNPTNSSIIWAITGNDVSQFNGTSWTSYPASTWVTSTLSPFVASLNVDPANGNHVVVGLDTCGTSFMFYTTDGGTTWYDITGDAPEIGTGNPIYIQAVTGRVFMGHGFGTWAANLTTPEGGDTTPPSAPTNLASPSQTTSTVSLTWTGSTDNVAVRAYDVYVGNYLSGSTMGTSWTVCGLATGTQYGFKVVARDDAGNQTSSSTLNVSTTGSGGPPPAPTGLTATAGNAQVALSWNASTGATAYDVKRSTVSGSGYVTVSSPTTTSYTNTGLTNGTTYYFVVDAKNASGTSGNSNQASATPAAGGSATNIFGNVTPGTPDGGADNSVELGCKFKSDVAGKITGVRFYKSTANTGTHTGTLWSISGTNLATVTFSGETSSGWQTASFSPAVSITANTDYVISYHCPGGHYAADSGYFLNGGHDNAPLHALKDGADGLDGCFTYGASTVFPTSGFNQTNYYVDVVFAPNGSGSLSGSVASIPASVNLTTEGTTDWAHWGLAGVVPGYDHKSSGGTKISTYTAVGTVSAFNVTTGQTFAFSWTDGTPDASITNTESGVVVSGVNDSLKITAPADTTQRTLKVYVGGWASNGKITAHLSDGSASDYVDSSQTAGAGTSFNVVYTLVYTAASAGQTLTVTWLENADNGGGNVSLAAATLH